jgi:hypothetical protein
MRRQAACVAILATFFAPDSFAQNAPANADIGVPPIVRFSGTRAAASGRVPITPMKR